MNTASRMQALAPRDGLVVGEQTWGVIRESFDGQPLEPVVVKGKAEPLRCWRVTGERAAPRPDASPLIGREDALAHLSSALGSVGGGPRIVTVVAEPGMGKSRLLAEFRRRTEAEGVPWRTTAFAPSGLDAPFAPLARLVRATALGAGNGHAGTAAEVDAVAEVAGADEDERRWLAARLGPVLGTDAGEGFEDAADTAMAVGRVLGATAPVPTVCAVEDLQWADPWVRGVLRGRSGPPRPRRCSCSPPRVRRGSPPRRARTGVSTTSRRSTSATRRP